MTRHVKVSTLAAVMPPTQHGILPAAVDQMVDYWRDNLSQVLPDRPDLIVTPEICDVCRAIPDEQVPDYLRVRGTRLLDLFCETAKQHNCYIAYSAYREFGEENWLNTIHMIDRNGDIAGTYDKNHPTEGEMTMGCVPGADGPLIECDFGSVAGAICFDLNFDRLRLQYIKSRPDMVLFTSVYHGGLMQKYWAYSCRTHFVSCIGGAEFKPSHIIAPNGRTLASSTNYTNFATTTINLDCAVVHFDYHNEKFEAMKQKYGPEVQIDDTGHLAAVLVTSESDARTVNDLLEEFEITRLDDYLARAEAAQAAKRL